MTERFERFFHYAIKKRDAGSTDPYVEELRPLAFGHDVNKALHISGGAIEFTLAQLVERYPEHEFYQVPITAKFLWSEVG